MMNEEFNLEGFERPTGRELLRLPPDTLARLLRQAIDETRRAKRRERWLRAIHAMKRGMDAGKQRGGK